MVFYFLCHRWCATRPLPPPKFTSLSLDESPDRFDNYVLEQVANNFLSIHVLQDDLPPDYVPLVKLEV